MWGNNAGKTGSNNTPLGPRKRMISDVQDSDDQPRGRSSEIMDRSGGQFSDSSFQRSSQPPRQFAQYAQHSQTSAPPPTNGGFHNHGMPSPTPPSGAPSAASPTKVRTEDGEEPKRKRRSRWAAEDEKVTIPGMPTALPTNMTEEQLEMYLLHTRLEEISRKLRTGDIFPQERERSPSPEPVYNAEGKRVNTRDFRYRKRLEDERHTLIEGAIKKHPDFKPPADYKRPSKLQDKVYIPAKEFPEINFIGLLIGPRGNTLKKMESESGAKISIRGRGSVKEGKSRSDTASSANQEEDLHCLVSADSEDKVKKAIQLINKIIETSASVPEGQNELKRMQLRELASLNGTLRDDENQTCLNCGGLGHRKYECPEIHNVTINLVCGICGGHGHATRDCRERHNPEAMAQAQQRDQKVDSEYLNLMAELGEKVPAGDTAGPQSTLVDHDRDRGERDRSDRDRGDRGGRDRDDRDRGDRSDRYYGRSQGSSSIPPWASNGNRDNSDSRTGGAAAPPPWAARSAATAAAHASSSGPSTPNGPASASSAAPWQQHSSGPPPPPMAAPWQQQTTSPAVSAAPWSSGSASGAGGPPPPPSGYPGANPYGYGYPQYPGYYSGYGTPPPPPPPSSSSAHSAPWAQSASGASGVPPPPPPSIPPPPPSSSHSRSHSHSQPRSPPPPPPSQ